MCFSGMLQWYFNVVAFSSNVKVTIILNTIIRCIAYSTSNRSYSRVNTKKKNLERHSIIVLEVSTERLYKTLPCILYAY